MTEIIVAVISGGLALLGTVLAVSAGMKKTEDSILNALQVSQAVQDEKLSELTREVKRHNDFAERIPSLEAKVASVEKRLDRLEG